MSDDRLSKIYELMLLDPLPDTPEGQELIRLVDEQIEAETHLFNNENKLTPTSK